jgi:hypothetical protein
MSVAARCSWPPSARKSTPARICTAVLVDTARATTPSFWTSSSREQLMFIPDPTATSVSMIFLL